jgi:hypothetical protein
MPKGKYQGKDVEYKKWNGHNRQAIADWLPKSYTVYVSEALPGNVLILAKGGQRPGVMVGQLIVKQGSKFIVLNEDMLD